EIEVENHLVRNFENGLAKAGVLFPFVRWCAGGNSQEKYAERLIGIKKMGFEKRAQVNTGRFYAKSEVNRSGGERVFDEVQQKYIIKEKTYSYDEIVADDLETVAAYNAGVHSKRGKFAGKSRMEVLSSTINPNLAPIDKAVLLRYIGERTTTTVTRNMYVQVQYAKYMLPSPEVLGRLGANNYKVEAYYLPDAEGNIGEVYLYQNGDFLSEAKKIVKYNTAQAERTEADTQSMTEQAKYISQFDKMVKSGKAEVANVKIIKNKTNYEALTPEIVDDIPVLEPHCEAVDAESNYSEERMKFSALDNL
ncbi:MAG: hypothetical protein ACRC3G_01265, partial [Bacteroidales bacterium]